MSKFLSALKGKSKTVNVNVIAGAIVTIATALGYTIPVEAVTAFFTIANVLLRFVTDQPLDEK